MASPTGLPPKGTVRRARSGLHGSKNDSRVSSGRTSRQSSVGLQPAISAAQPTAQNFSAALGIWEQFKKVSFTGAAAGLQGAIHKQKGPQPNTHKGLQL